MRSVLVVVGLIVGSSFASADPADNYRKPWERDDASGVSFEIGGGWQRIHPNGFTYRSEYLRFAPQISFKRWFYVGAALQLGNIYGAYGAPDGSIAGIAANTFSDEGSGSSFAGQVFLGVRDLIGIVAVGGEVAPTVRSTSAGLNYDYAEDKTSVTTVELHGRVDVWATPHLTAGVMASMDIASIRDFQLGLQVAFHFDSYDAMKSSDRHR